LLSAALSGQSVFNGPRDYIVGSYPDSVIVGDFNEDGLPDVAVANQYSSGISVLLQNSDGTFQLAVNYAVGSQPTSLQTGDVNGDGKLDLVVLNSQDSTISVLLGNGDGTFQAQKVTSIPQFLGVPSLAVGNFNGDSYLDVAIGVPFAASWNLWGWGTAGQRRRNFSGCDEHRPYFYYIWIGGRPPCST
jgi:hypothetical protein